MTAATSASAASGVLDGPSSVALQNDPVQPDRDNDQETQPTATGSLRNPVVLRDPRAIKALAHPARLAVIDEFFTGRKLTATECAEIACLSASAMSYHLRALEKWGIIRRSETTGDGRERPWEAAGDRLMVDSAEPRASAAGEAILVARLLDRERADTLNWISGRDENSSTWYDATAISSGIYWLTHDEAQLFGERIGALLAEFDGRSATHGREGARRVRVSFSVVPTPAEPPEGLTSPHQAPDALPATAEQPNEPRSDEQPDESVPAERANRSQPSYRRIRRI